MKVSGVHGLTGEVRVQDIGGDSVHESSLSKEVVVTVCCAWTRHTAACVAIATHGAYEMWCNIIRQAGRGQEDKAAGALVVFIVPRRHQATQKCTALRATTTCYPRLPAPLSHITVATYYTCQWLHPLHCDFTIKC